VPCLARLCGTSMLLTPFNIFGLLRRHLRFDARETVGAVRD
jgi:hypothetical protein